MGCNKKQFFPAREIAVKTFGIKTNGINNFIFLEELGDSSKIKVIIDSSQSDSIIFIIAYSHDDLEMIPEHYEKEIRYFKEFQFDVRYADTNNVTCVNAWRGKVDRPCFNQPFEGFFIEDFECIPENFHTTIRKPVGQYIITHLYRIYSHGVCDTFFDFSPYSTKVVCDCLKGYSFDTLKTKENIIIY